jgi:integrase
VSGLVFISQQHRAPYITARYQSESCGPFLGLVVEYLSLTDIPDISQKGTLSDWAVWSIVEQSSKQIGIEHFGAHDLRRTCAKLCGKSGGDLEQIKFLLGHSSIQTTERYLGSDQEIAVAVNDNLGL